MNRQINVVEVFFLHSSRLLSADKRIASVWQAVIVYTNH